MAASSYQKIIRFFNVLQTGGLNETIISPGSRNAPLIKAMNELKFTIHSALDERSAGFMALGMTKATGKPIILCCTSGTAVLNYYPAIAEAFYSRLPMIVLTADRPFEKIDQWDGQAIRQNGVFENHIRYQCQFNPTKNLTNPELLANEVLTLFQTQIPGPVHINVPLAEPLYQFSTPNIQTPLIQTIPTAGTTLKEDRHIGADQVQRLLGANWQGQKVLLFQGMNANERINLSALGEPLLCDVTAGRFGNINNWDALLHTSQNDLSKLAYLQPDILISSGTTTVSKGLKVFLQKYPPKRHVHISPFSEVGDMFNSKPEVIDVSHLEDAVHRKDVPKSSYGEEWYRAEQIFEKSFSQLPWESYCAFSVVRELLRSISPDTKVHCANSMMVRYASFLASRGVIANRGTSGIDGCTSTAVGYAIQSQDAQFLITGDLAFLYDINGLYHANLPNNFKIAVLNDGGGGIFNLIDGPREMGEAITLQTTPHQRNVESLAEHFGIDYLCAIDSSSLSDCIEKWLKGKQTTILEVKTDNLEDRRFYELFNKLKS